MKAGRIKLDNPSNMYAALSSAGRGYNFRVSVVLTEAVDGNRLREAVISLAPRFPVMYSHLAKSTFGYYHVPATNFDIVSESPAPHPFLTHDIVDTDKPSFAIYWYENRIMLTLFHANADGSAAATYLRSLVTRYFELGGMFCSPCEGVLRINESPSPEELRDDYSTIYKRGKRLSRNESTAFVLRTEYTPGLIRRVCVCIPIDSLKAYTKPRSLTATEYLLALLYEAICKYYSCSEDTLPIKLSVPIDLRKIFNSKTLRNFALYTNLELYPKDRKDFDSDAREISRQLKAGLDKDRLIALASTNVALERNIFVRAVPRALRDFSLKKGYRILGAAKITTTLSNIGIQKLPPELDDKVERFEMYLGAGKGGLNIAAAGYNNTLSLCISLSGEDDTIVNTVVERMKSHGIDAQVYENPKYYKQ